MSDQQVTDFLPGQRVKWNMGGDIGRGLYVTWLPYPDSTDCHLQVVSEEYGLLVFPDDGTLQIDDTQPRIEITGSMIRRFFDELRRIGAEVTYAVTGTIIDYADAKTALDVALNRQCKEPEEQP